MRLSQFERKTVCRMFARGENCDRVAEAMDISLKRAEKQYLLYLDLPLSEKLSMTLLPELVTNRVHRLADDIKDIERIDALLSAADEKTLVSLLDMKRKIKERMMKDWTFSSDASPNSADSDIEEEIAECYEKIMGGAG
jgi:hypothetical protein